MILVTGGTGLVGAHLILSLLEKGETVRAIYRNKGAIYKTQNLFSSYDKNFLFDQIEWIQADINDIPSLENAFIGVTTVYHCAAHVSFHPSVENLTRKINIQGTANIVNMALHHEVKKLCHVSSIAALGHPRTLSEEITEETEWNPELAIDTYAISKYGAEMEVLRGQQEGLNTVMVNPGIILGPGFWNQSSGELFSKIKNGLSFFPKGNAPYTDIHDLIKIMITLTEGNYSGERYTVVNENCSYESIFKSIDTHVNSRKKMKPAPELALKGYYYLCTVLNFFGYQKLYFSKSMYTSANSVKNYSSKKIIETLNYKFKPITQSIKETASFF